MATDPMASETTQPTGRDHDHARDAVEPTARAMFAWDTEEHSDPAPTWEMLTEDQRDVWRSGARACIDTAGPIFLAAEGEQIAKAFNDFADMVDRGPQIPLQPSIYSALARERATDIRSAS